MQLFMATNFEFQLLIMQHLKNTPKTGLRSLKLAVAGDCLVFFVPNSSGPRHRH